MDKILFWVIFIASLSKAIFWIPFFPDVVYYGSFLVCFIWMILRGGMHVSGNYLFFISAILFSIWLNDIPSFFKVWFRMLAFFSIVFVVGPFFMNDRLIHMRKLLFTRTLLILRWMVLFSFLLKFIAPDMVTGETGFNGLVNHSMLLSPLAGICVLYGLYRFYLSETNTGRCKEVIFTGVSFLVLMLAGSRGAFAATLVGGGFFYIRLYKHRIGKLVQTGLFFLLLLVSTSTIWWPYTERLREKMNSNEDAGSVTFSRDGLWEDRLNEFRAFPVFGVGFSSYNLDYIQSEHSINRESGTVEPGSSWLFLLSSIGLYGLLSFLLPVSHVLYVLYKDTETGLNGGLVSSVVVLFAVHMLIEGYIVASGAYLCFLFWLTLSEGEQMVRYHNKKIQYQ